jgi:hypothetical protein
VAINAGLIAANKAAFGLGKTEAGWAERTEMNKKENELWEYLGNYNQKWEEKVGLGKG